MAIWDGEEESRTKIIEFRGSRFNPWDILWLSFRELCETVVTETLRNEGSMQQRRPSDQTFLHEGPIIVYQIPTNMKTEVREFGKGSVFPRVHSDNAVADSTREHDHPNATAVVTKKSVEKVRKIGNVRKRTII
jgi:hypothetical protein